MSKGLKIAVTGKGGVGKTTVSGLLARMFARKGWKVVALDADPVPCLASSLGIEDPESIVPIADMKELIEERTGAKPGGVGSFFKANPKVDDLPEALAKERDGVRLMVMGTVEKGGGGCVCPESVLLKTLATHLFLYRDEVVIMDMEAGVEHLGRATARAVDLMLVVVEPGSKSFAAAKMIKRLADEIGVSNVALVANKVGDQTEEDYVRKTAGETPLLGVLRHDPHVAQADRAGEVAYPDLDAAPPEVDELFEKVLEASRKPQQ